MRRSLPYHVDRSKLFVSGSVGGSSPQLDAERVARAIEFTRFPASPDGRWECKRKTGRVGWSKPPT